MNTQDEISDISTLNTNEQCLVSIAALTAIGNIQQLKIELNKGLDAGLTINEIKEALVQLYAYCGFPRSLNSINTLMAVLEDRKGKGVIDIIGKDASAIVYTVEKYEAGKQTLQKLTGREDKGPATGANAFAPVIDTFLKEHLFADIFSRDVLNYRQREFVTIAALASMTGVEPQLQAHISMGMNTGISEQQLCELIVIIENTVSRQQGAITKNVFAKVLESNKPK